MSGHGIVKTQPVIVADIRLQSITIISCLRSQNAIIIPTLWLKIKEILRLCGTVGWWMDGIKLKLNQKITEFITIGQKAFRELLAPNFPVPLLQTISLRQWK